MSPLVDQQLKAESATRGKIAKMSATTDKRSATGHQRPQARDVKSADGRQEMRTTDDQTKSVDEQEEQRWPRLEAASNRGEELEQGNFGQESASNGRQQEEPGGNNTRATVPVRAVNGKSHHRRKRAYRRSMSQSIVRESSIQPNRGASSGRGRRNELDSPSRCHSNGPLSRTQPGGQIAAAKADRLIADYDVGFRGRASSMTLPQDSKRTVMRRQTSITAADRDKKKEKERTPVRWQVPMAEAVAANKKTMATYLDHESKDMVWLTNLVETQNESDPDHADNSNLANCSDDCVFLDPPNSQWHPETDYQSAPATKETIFNERAGSEDFIVKCKPFSSSSVGSFSPAHHHGSCLSNSTQRFHKFVGGSERGKSLYRNMGHFFRYPRFQMDSSASSANDHLVGAAASSSSKHSTSTACSDSFDLASSVSRQRLTTTTTGTKSPTGVGRSRSALKMALESVKLLLLRNLVAALIGLYILVSLTIIVVLVLPYLCDSRRQSTLKTSSSSMTTSGLSDGNASGPLMDQAPYKTPGSGETRQQPRVGSQKTMDLDKGTQTVPVNILEAGLDPRLTPPPAVRVVESSNSSRGTLVAPIAASTETSDNHRNLNDLGSKQATIQAPIVGGGTGSARNHSSSPASMKSSQRNSRFGSLWSVNYNQQCQPMKIPFCSRSLAALLSNTGLPSNRLDLLPLKGHVAYDKTLLPNQLTKARQSQIDKILQKYDPIIDIKCYALMPLFLCSIHAPKCVQQASPLASPSAGGDDTGPVGSPGDSSSLSSSSDSFIAAADDDDEGAVQFATTARPAPTDDDTQRRMKAATTGAPPLAGRPTTNSSVARLIPPCRSLCKEAFRKCMFFFEVLSLKFLDQKDCDSLPESSDSLVCVGHLENELLQRAASSQSCGEDKFRCTDGECISKKWRCDGFNDCTDKSDEMNCSKCNPRTQFYCGLDVCIGKDLVCNGIRDCRDGRDERQCLRLAPVVSGNNSPRQQQLQAWSAVKDTWVPVCGAHWSAMPLSHQACQALGYSRANETLILYGPTSVSADETGATVMGAPKNITTRRPATRSAPAAASQSEVERRAGHEQRVVVTNSLRGRRSPAGSGWFDVSSGDSFASNSDITDGLNDNAQLASIVEDVTGSADDAAPSRGANLGVSQKVTADHSIRYERKLLPGQGEAPWKGDDGRQPPGPLPAAFYIDAGQTKLKSLHSMLYHGPEDGCLGRPEHLVSSVHLQCQNFQCGRSISSYSSRIRLQSSQRPTKRASISRASAIAAGPDRTIWGSLGLRALPAALRSPLGWPNLTSGSGSGSEDDHGDDDDDDDDHYDAHDGSSELQRHHNGTKIRRRRVVGGIESIPGEFPYLAALHGGPDEVFFCGGVLISINWLLTAAHCVGNRTRPDGWMVKVGVTRRIASPAFVKKLTVRKIIKHPKFNEGTMFNNDLALILLEESVEYNQYLRPICLPKANLRLGPDNSKDCVVVGFGKSKYSQEANYLHVAHFVDVPIVHHTICSNWYAEHGVNLTDGMLCAGYAEGKRDACQGDSGSGLFCRYSNTSQFFVAGLVSFGIRCANPKLPGIYASVPSYVDWVEQVTRQHGYPLA